MRSKPIQLTIISIIFSLLSASSYALKTVTLKAGDSITISGAPTKVSCEASSDETSDTDRCDNFHSDDTCRKLKVGSSCKKFGTEKLGTCISEDTFGGVLNCRCHAQ